MPQPYYRKELLPGDASPNTWPGITPRPAVILLRACDVSRPVYTLATRGFRARSSAVTKYNADTD